MGAAPFSEIAGTVGLDSRLIAKMRLVLALTVLFIIGPSDLDDSLGIFHLLATLYVVYSALQCLVTLSPVQRFFARISYLADISWAGLLVIFSDESSTAFLFLFPILIASFQWSFVAALRLTLLAALLASTIGLMQEYLEEELQLHEILLPPIYLLVFGYLVARWGDREVTAKRRLMLLKELTKLSNPRFGIDRMVGMMMERLRAFHDAETCLMIVADIASDEHVLRRADRRHSERAVETEVIPAETAKLLLAPPPDQALVYPDTSRRREWWQALKADYYMFDNRKGRSAAVPPATVDALVTVLDCESFISAPLRYSESTIGRLYLTATRKRAFTSADVGFLIQVIEQIVPVIENIRLVDQLASSAAEEERRRLARDIHDSVIQSYIGFQIGLAAISQKVQAGVDDIGQDISRLMNTTEEQIESLRHYVQGLPGTSKRESALPMAIRRFVTTFTEATRIAVEVDVVPNLYINDRLVAEVFQMVVEGLSNIRRHTRATCARIGLARQDDCFILQIVNDGADAGVPASFMPWSITERASALGGQAQVEHIAGGRTQVTVKIPL